MTGMVGSWTYIYLVDLYISQGPILYFMDIFIILGHYFEGSADVMGVGPALLLISIFFLKVRCINFR